jgi:hypothetical protein
VAAPQDEDGVFRGNPFINIKFFGFPWILIPVPETCLILLKSCPIRGASRGVTEVGQSESWSDRGAPDRSMAWWPVERREALRLALGARGALPREVGTLLPPQGCPLVPWRLPPLHRLARDWQTSDALRRENAEAWLFEI